jgi:hypothetical protein
MLCSTRPGQTVSAFALRTQVLNRGDKAMPAHSLPAADPLAFLAALPKRRRNAILAYVNTLLTDDLEPVAIFWKGRRPDSTDEEIALICGVSRATLANWKLYQEVKPRLGDYPHIRRQPTKFRRTRDGGRWPLDHPDRF